MTPAEAALVTTVDKSTQAILHNGLQWAVLLHRHFPEAYAERVTNRKTDRASLANMALYFLTLAHVYRIALAYEGLPLSPKEPERILRGYWGDSTAGYQLVGELENWRLTPRPRVYGMSRSLPVLHKRGHVIHGRYDYNRPPPLEQNALAIALWRLASSGHWAQIPDPDLRTEATYYNNGDVVRALVRNATPIPATIANSISWSDLCARLDRLQPEGVKNLGAVLAYVCGQTGDPYADRVQYELGREGGTLFDLNWRRPPEHFVAERARQTAASRLASRYRSIDRAVYQNPGLLSRLCATIHQTAFALAEASDHGDGAPYPATAPRTLISTLLEDDPNPIEETL